MTEELFDVLDELAAKQEKLVEVLNILGGEDGNYPFLDEAMNKTEKAIVMSLGGNEGHYEHVSSTDFFTNYYDRKSDEAKQELIDYIKSAVEHDWTEEVGIEITLG